MPCLITLLALRLAARNHGNSLTAALIANPQRAHSESGWPWVIADDHWRKAQRQAIIMSQMDIAVLPIWQLPTWLQNLPNTPVALFCRGDSELLHRKAWSVVGSRQSSTGALQWTASKAQEAVREGFMVVSGGALGIDGEAHRAALKAGGTTLAYLGVAADRVYPGAHKPLFAQILMRGGAILSEFAPGESTPPFSHAWRNRFIAGHAECLWVAEARARSGTLSTAHFAHKLAIPVRVSPPNVKGQRAGLDELVAKGIATHADH